MTINKIKFAEWGIHFLAILVILMTGLDSYERSMWDIRLQEGHTIGFYIFTNSDQIFWHILVYGLFILSWFLFYYGIYKRYQQSIKTKLRYGLTAWIFVSITHGVIVYLISLLLGSRPDTGSLILNFNVTFELGETSFAIYFIIGAVSFMAQTTVQFLKQYRELEEVNHMQSELALIRSQLRPHFFFNTLNNLYSMALETGNDDLADGIQNLTGMMRHSLKHSVKELVPLREEWDYINRYVDLQKLRINQESVDIDSAATGNLNSAQVAPMILINFVENAFKHGISYEKPSFVRVQLHVTEELIVLTVTNSNHPSTQETGESGIGTAQTKKLLDVYYADNYQLDIDSTKDDYSITLKLPIR